MAVVVFPDAVDVVIGYLQTELAARGDSVPVRPRVPNPRPSRLVRVQRVGGVRRDIVTDVPMLTVECWAPTEEDAHDLAQLCRALIYDLPGTTQAGVAFYRASDPEVGGPAVLPDPLSAEPRVVFTVQLAVRGAKEVTP